MTRLLARDQCTPGGKTGRTRGIGTSKMNASSSDGIEIRRLQDGVTINTQTIPSVLIGHEEQDVGTVNGHAFFKSIRRKRRLPFAPN